MNYYGANNDWWGYLAHSGKKGMRWGYTDGKKNGNRTANETADQRAWNRAKGDVERLGSNGFSTPGSIARMNKKYPDSDKWVYDPSGKKRRV